MDHVSLAVPQAIADALPAESDEAIVDMQRAVEGYERQLNDSLTDLGDYSGVVDAIERFEQRWEAYDEYVVELRSWGQSPIYAMVWRDLHAALIQQLYDHDELAAEIDRERHARIVQDGIRFNS